jgi:hypothetical protein
MHEQSSHHMHVNYDLIGGEPLQVPDGGDLHRTTSKTSTTAAQYGSSEEDEDKTKKTEKAKEPLRILGISYVRLRDEGAHAYEL